MRHRFRNVGTWGAVVLFVAAIVTFGSTILYGLEVQQTVDEKVCQSAVDNRAAVRLTWDAARDLILTGQTDEERIAATNDFFNRVLGQVPPLVCEESEPIEVP